MACSSSGSATYRWSTRSRAHDVHHVGQRAEERQAAIAQMVAAGAVVHEPDHLIPQLAVLEHALGHLAPQVAGAGDQDPLQADARTPAPLQQLADRLARGVGEHHVEGQEECPHQLRHFEGAAGPGGVGRVVGLEVQGGHHAQHDGQDAADEHGEEVVHA